METQRRNIHLSDVFLIAGKSEAYRQTVQKIFTMSDEQARGCLVQSHWTRSGLLAHLQAHEGRCLIGYEEMDGFFSSVVR